MRNTGYYGTSQGAHIVELRRGSVHHVAIGSVERFPPAEVPIRGLLKFHRLTTIRGKPAKQLATALSGIALACAKGQISLHDRQAQFDAAIRSAGS